MNLVRATNLIRPCKGKKVEKVLGRPISPVGIRCTNFFWICSPSSSGTPFGKASAKNSLGRVGNEDKKPQGRICLRLPETVDFSKLQSFTSKFHIRKLDSWLRPYLAGDYSVVICRKTAGVKTIENDWHAQITCGTCVCRQAATTHSQQSYSLSSFILPFYLYQYVDRSIYIGPLYIQHSSKHP